jgi:hypothetical protein
MLEELLTSTLFVFDFDVYIFSGEEEENDGFVTAGDGG